MPKITNIVDKLSNNVNIDAFPNSSGDRILVVIIVVINPTTGAVEGRINLVGLYSERASNNNELNGIAYDSANKRLFVTGKLWPKLYEIKLVER